MRLMLLLTAVRRSLKEIGTSLTPADKAAAELAQHYAQMIDTSKGALLNDLGPKLLAALESLGMTPRARRALVKEASGGPVSPLDQLRERRERRRTG